VVNCRATASIASKLLIAFQPIQNRSFGFRQCGGTNKLPFRIFLKGIATKPKKSSVRFDVGQLERNG